MSSTCDLTGGPTRHIRHRGIVVRGRERRVRTIVVVDGHILLRFDDG